MGPDYGRDLLAKGAGRGVVDLGHVVLQAHAVLGLTPTHARDFTSRRKFLQSQFEYALRTCLTTSSLKWKNMLLKGGK